MSFRHPTFQWLHQIRDRGSDSSGIASLFGGLNSVYDCFDGTHNTSFRFESSRDDHIIFIDLGTTWSNACTRLVIPEGHNLNGGYVQIVQDDAFYFPTPTTLLASTAIATDGWVEITTVSATQRFMAILFPTTAGQWELPEIWLTNAAVGTVQSPESGWVDTMLPNTTQLESGETVRRASDKRHFEFSYEHLGSETVIDLGLIDALKLFSAGDRTFLFYPPDSTEDPIVCRFDQPITEVVDSEIPAAGTETRSVELSFTEVAP